MSIILFDRHKQFSGLQEVIVQGWIILDARELRLPMFEPVSPGFVRMIIMLMGEILLLIKGVNLIFDAHDIVKRALTNMPGAAAIPTLGHIVEALKNLSFPHTKDEYIRSALTELCSMLRSVGVIWNYSYSQMAHKLIAPGAHTVIRTGELDHKEELFLLCWLLLFSIETGLVSPRNYIAFFMIDECQHLFGKQMRDSNMLRTLKSTILTARHPGVALIAGSQMPSLLEPELLASASTLICTGLQDNDNIWQVAKAMGVAHGQY